MLERLPPDRELIEFFGAEPDVLDAGVPWLYNQVTFVTERESDRLVFTLAPAYGELKVIWSCGGADVVSAELSGLRTLEVDTLQPPSPSLIVKDGGGTQLRLWLEPRVRLFLAHREPPAGGD